MVCVKCLARARSVQGTQTFWLRAAVEAGGWEHRQYEMRLCHFPNTLGKATNFKILVSKLNQNELTIGSPSQFCSQFYCEEEMDNLCEVFNLMPSGQ